MPFCPQCGIENPESARFCDQCGAALIPVHSGGSQPPISSIGMSTINSPVVSAGPSMCPQCGFAVIPGEAFCDNCGATLITGIAFDTSRSAAPIPPYGGIPPQPSYPAPQPISLPPAAAQAMPSPTPPPPPPVTPPKPIRSALAPSQLMVQASGVAVALPAVAQAVIGRADPVSHFFPDIDLTPYGALDYGVGRRHARLRVWNDQIVIEDLDSTNGTFINEQKLSPNVPYPLHDGDKLRFGSLVLRFQLG